MNHILYIRGIIRKIIFTTCNTVLQDRATLPSKAVFNSKNSTGWFVQEMLKGTTSTKLTSSATWVVRSIFNPIPMSVNLEDRKWMPFSPKFEWDSLQPLKPRAGLKMNGEKRAEAPLGGQVGNWCPVSIDERENSGKEKPFWALSFRVTRLSSHSPTHSFIHTGNLE